MVDATKPSARPGPADAPSIVAAAELGRDSVRLAVAGQERTTMPGPELGVVQQASPSATSQPVRLLARSVYLYDTLAGGAGFARQAGEHGLTLFQDAIELLEGCPGQCDRSCYRCLRSFKNRFEHGLLDRFVGASLLRYLVYETDPVLDRRRLDQAADRLYTDLVRHGLEGVEFQRRSTVDIPAIGRVEAPILARVRGRDSIIGIHGPLTPDHAADERIQEAKEFGTAMQVLLIDEMVVSQNLPRASQQVFEALG